MKRLQEKDLVKLSAVTEIPLVHLQKIHNIGGFDDGAIFNHLIRADYKRLRKGKRYPVKLICEAIAQEYNVSIHKVFTATYSQDNPVIICPQCGRETKKSELKRNEGICNTCVVEKLKT